MNLELLVLACSGSPESGKPEVPYGQPLHSYRDMSEPQTETSGVNSLHTSLASSESQFRYNAQASSIFKYGSLHVKVTSRSESQHSNDMLIWMTNKARPIW